jgi:hypothetical protein
MAEEGKAATAEGEPRELAGYAPFRRRHLHRTAAPDRRRFRHHK